MNTSATITVSNAPIGIDQRPPTGAHYLRQLASALCGSTKHSIQRIQKKLKIKCGAAMSAALHAFLEVFYVTLASQFAGLPQLLRVSEVAEFTGTHERTVRRWIKDGRLMALEHPGGIRVSRRALWRFLGLDFSLSA